MHLNHALSHDPITHLSLTKQEQWGRIQARIRSELGENIYQSIIQHITLTSEGHDITLSLPNEFMKSWINNYYKQRMEDMWRIEDETIQNINVQCDQVHHATVPTSISQETVATKIPKANDNAFDLSITYDKRFSFDTFITDNTNKLAFQAAMQASTAESMFNPLFIYGSVGTGKTHLLQALAQSYKQNFPEHTCIYMSAEKFMFYFVQSLRSSNVHAFKQYIREAHILLIDDIQFLIGKQSTQDEFFHALDAFLTENKQVIISCDTSPENLDIPDRIKSRLSGGLAVNLPVPSASLRCKILASKQKEEAILSDDILSFMSDRITQMRPLEGAYNRLKAHTIMTGQPLSLEEAQHILKDLAPKRERCSISTIQECVAKHFNVSLNDLTSARRTKTVATARQCAMYLTKKLTPSSLPEIGRKFGGRDHATVLYAVNKITTMMENEDFKTIMLSLEEEINTP